MGARGTGQPWPGVTMPMQGQVMEMGEGGLEICIETAAGWIRDARLRSSRPVRAGALLEGREVTEAAALLSRMFRLCGIAQTVAGLRAMETALALAPGPAQEASRELLVAAESCEQSAWRIAIDWPQAIGVAPEVGTLKRLRRRVSRLRGRLGMDAAWSRPGGVAMTPDIPGLRALVEEVAVLMHGLTHGDDAARDQDYRRFSDWFACERCTAARVLSYIEQRGLAGLGCSDVPRMGVMERDILRRRLAADRDWAYCREPDYQGEVLETGPLARMAQHPLVKEVLDRHGNGLLARFTARLLQIEEFIADMRAAVGKLADCVRPVARLDGSGDGLGVVETMRGRLTHWVAVERGRIARYRILAPTEWNFHPRGALARGLQGCRVEPPTREIDVALLVTALDPCVGYQVRFRESRSCTN